MRGLLTPRTIPFIVCEALCGQLSPGEGDFCKNLVHLGGDVHAFDDEEDKESEDCRFY